MRTEDRMAMRGRKLSKARIRPTAMTMPSDQAGRLA